MKQSAGLLEQLEEWDEELKNVYWERERRAHEKKTAARVEQAEKKDAEWWAFYDEHIKSAKWRGLRRAVIRRCGGRCEGCAEAEVEHVHHLTYNNLGDELLFQLVGLCRDCHQRVHPGRDLARGAA
jgi:5-methylcytosine-specific restriction endonuclease McrA